MRTRRFVSGVWTLGAVAGRIISAMEPRLTSSGFASGDTCTI